MVAVHKHLSICFPVFLLALLQLQVDGQQSTVNWWLTNPDNTAVLQKQKALATSAKAGVNGAVIKVNDKEVFQTMDGFGYALTGGSAGHIIKMSAPARKALLNELFTTAGNNIGVSYLRVSIGASDLNDHVFSYDDLPKGETDTAMTHFDLGPDKKDVIPVLKEILAIAPKVKILGSPWSPPAWMKTNHDTRGGRVKPEYYDAYAKYFVLYIKGMAKEGITIDAITVQNEPLHPGNNPSLLLPAPDEAIFIKDHLGPAFAKAGIKTKIIIYDHNADRPDYPIDILNDREAAKYIDGSGFHLYGGEIEALTEVHNEHPDKHIYFTEQMVVQPDASKGFHIADPVERVIIGACRNWCRNVLLWNLAADPENKPFTDRGGCSMCQGAVTIDGDKVTRNLAWYALAHASKFVPAGSIRIGSSSTDSLKNVAFKTPAGKMVLLVANISDSDKSFTIQYKSKAANAQLKKGAVATYVW
jgi:glucosylceramidase